MIKHLYFCLAFALLPSFIYSNYHLFQTEYSNWSISDFALSWSIELLCLPIALLLLLLFGEFNNTKKIIVCFNRRHNNKTVIVQSKSNFDITHLTVLYAQEKLCQNQTE